MIAHPTSPRSWYATAAEWWPNVEDVGPPFNQQLSSIGFGESRSMHNVKTISTVYLAQGDQIGHFVEGAGLTG